MLEIDLPQHDAGEISNSVCCKWSTHNGRCLFVGPIGGLHDHLGRSKSSLTGIGMSNQTSRERSRERGQLQRNQYCRRWGRGFSQICHPYSYSSGYSVGDPPQTRQHFDGGWHGGNGQQGAYNGTISHQGNRDGGQNSYHGQGRMLPFTHRNLGHHGGCGECGHQPRRQDVFVQEGFSNKCGIEGNNNGTHNGSGETFLVPDGELCFINNAYKIHEQGNRQYDYDMGFT